MNFLFLILVSQWIFVSHSCFLKVFCFQFLFRSEIFCFFVTSACDSETNLLFHNDFSFLRVICFLLLKYLFPNVFLFLIFVSWWFFVSSWISCFFFGSFLFPDVFCCLILLFCFVKVNFLFLNVCFLILNLVF